MKWRAHKKAGFLSQDFEIGQDSGGFKGIANKVQTAQ